MSLSDYKQGLKGEKPGILDRTFNSEDSAVRDKLRGYEDYLRNKDLADQVAAQSEKEPNSDSDSRESEENAERRHRELIEALQDRSGGDDYDGSYEDDERSSDDDELQIRIDELEAENNELKGRVAKLEEALNLKPENSSPIILVEGVKKKENPPEISVIPQTPVNAITQVAPPPFVFGGKQLELIITYSQGKINAWQFNKMFRPLLNGTGAQKDQTIREAKAQARIVKAQARMEARAKIKNRRAEARAQAKAKIAEAWSRANQEIEELKRQYWSKEIGLWRYRKQERRVWAWFNEQQSYVQNALNVQLKELGR